MSLFAIKELEQHFPSLNPSYIGGEKAWVSSRCLPSYLSWINSQHILDGLENPINTEFALITKFPQDISDPPHFAIWTTCTSTNCWLLNHCRIICTSTTYWTNSTKGKSMFSNTSVIGHLKNEADWLYHHLLSKSFLASYFLEKLRFYMFVCLGLNVSGGEEGLTKCRVGWWCVCVCVFFPKISKWPTYHSAQNSL